MKKNRGKRNTPPRILRFRKKSIKLYIIALFIIAILLIVLKDYFAGLIIIIAACVFGITHLKSQKTSIKAVASYPDFLGLIYKNGKKIKIFHEDIRDCHFSKLKNSLQFKHKGKKILIPISFERLEYFVQHLFESNPKAFGKAKPTKIITHLLFRYAMLENRILNSIFNITFLASSAWILHIIFIEFMKFKELNQTEEIISIMLVTFSAQLFWLSLLVLIFLVIAIPSQLTFLIKKRISSTQQYPRGNTFLITLATAYIPGFLTVLAIFLYWNSEPYKIIDLDFGRIKAKVNFVVTNPKVNDFVMFKTKELKNTEEKSGGFGVITEVKEDSVVIATKNKDFQDIKLKSIATFKFTPQIKTKSSEPHERADEVKLFLKGKNIKSKLMNCFAISKLFEYFMKQDKDSADDFAAKNAPTS